VAWYGVDRLEGSREEGHRGEERRQEKDTGL